MTVEEKKKNKRGKKQKNKKVASIGNTEGGTRNKHINIQNYKHIKNEWVLSKVHSNSIVFSLFLENKVEFLKSGKLKSDLNRRTL